MKSLGSSEPNTTSAKTTLVHVWFKTSRKKYNGRLPLSEEHMALIGGQQTRAKCEPDALSAKPHNWSHISGEQKHNRPTTSCSMRLSDFPPLARRASIITETAAAHLHNCDTPNRPSATERFATTSTLALFSWWRTTQATHRQNISNEAHKYCGINKYFNYSHYGDRCNYRLLTSILFDWHAVK